MCSKLGTVSNNAVGVNKNHRNLELIHIKGVEAEDYPYVVHLKILGNNIFCVGIIVTTTYVLTSADCVKKYAESKVFNFTVSAGVDFTNAYKSVRRVKEITIHPEYAADKHNNAKNNLALLKIGFPLKAGSTIDTVELPSEYERVPDGAEAKYIKWVNDPKTGNLHKRMRAFDATFYSTKECNVLLAGKRKLTEQQVCVVKKESTAGPCLWDSGSPLLVKNRLVGILTDNPNTMKECDTSTDKPIVYASIASHAKWIKEVSAGEYNYVKLAIIVIVIILVVPVVGCYCFEFILAVYRACFKPPPTVRGRPPPDNVILY